MDRVASFSNVVLRKKDERGKLRIIPVLTTHPIQDGRVGHDYEFSPEMPKGLVGLTSSFHKVLETYADGRCRERWVSKSGKGNTTNKGAQEKEKIETPRRGDSHKKLAAGGPVPGDGCRERGGNRRAP
jgi:hypothetical protein